jgi:hypothetical protein
MWKRKRDRAQRKLGRWAREALALRKQVAHSRKRERVLRQTIQGVRRRYAHADKEVTRLRESIKAGGSDVDLRRWHNELNAATVARDKLGDRIILLEEKIEAQQQVRTQARDRIRGTITRKRYWRKRLRFTVVKLANARKLYRQRQKKNPNFESWMANGCDWQNTNQATRRFVARMVVRHGLTTTSMNRTYVPAGGSTTSYHLVGKAGDVAGSWEAMNEAQKDEYQRSHGKAECLELFGPDNSANLKNGVTLGMAEGSALENLHDSHVHGAFQ